MNGKGDGLLWIIAILAILVSFVNPGGLLVGLVIAFAILGGRYGLPFLGDIVKERQYGVSSAKVSRRARDRVRREPKREDDK